MAETLTELVAKIKTDATELKQGLSESEKATEASSQKMSASLQKVGMAMTASGAAITAALGFMGKAAIDEEINMKRLATTIENSGTSYDSVKDSMEALIATTQRKTGIADNEQRDILNRLILVTNDYGKALELLPTVLDLAAAGEMDATTAATYLGKAYLELEQGAEKVSVRFGQASLQFKNMEDIQNRVAGAAENLANPLSVLKASIGDVAEAIGANLIPMIKGAVDKIVDIAEKVQNWMKENPKLAKTLTITTGAIGAFLGVTGSLLLILSKLISLAPLVGGAFHAMLGPIGLVTGLVAALVAGLGFLFTAMKGARAETNEWTEALKIAKKELANLEESGYGMGKRANELREQIDRLNTALETHNKLVKEGTVNEYNLADAYEQRAKLTEKIAKHQEKLNRLKAEEVREGTGYADIISRNIEKQEIAIANLESEYITLTDAIRKQIDGMENLDAIFEKAPRDIRDYIDTLRVTQWELERTAAAANKLKEEAEDTEEAIDGKTKAIEEEKTADEEAADSIDKLVDSLEHQRSEAGKLGITIEDVVDALIQGKKWTDKTKESLISLGGATADVNEFLDVLGITAQYVSGILEKHANEIDRVGDSYDTAKEKAEEFASTQEELAKQQEELARQQEMITSATAAGARTPTQIPALQSAWDEVRKLRSSGLWEAAQEYQEKILMPLTQKVWGFQKGGIVPGGIGQPQLAMVHGGETIVPPNKSLGGVTVNFTQPVFFEREDDMNRFVDKISRTLDRKYRLSGRL